MPEEKLEVISYQLPPMAIERESPLIDSAKIRQLANKSFLTNFISVLTFGATYFTPDFFGRKAIMMAGLFAFSGALTNWLAVYMLFERIPWLYGSGIITLRFRQFKESIRALILENFFTEENFARVVSHTVSHNFSTGTIVSMIDFDKVFNGFLTVVRNSSFGGMLKMFGGEKVLEPLRRPFKVEFERQATELVSAIDTAALLKRENGFETFRPRIEAMVDSTLNELTPQRVKEIVEGMIRAHLGWLVVWGGVFGAIIGCFGAVFF